VADLPFANGNFGSNWVQGVIVAEEKLNANDTLSKVLAYVDSPFKLFALILMAILSFAGWMFYDNKDLLIGAYKEQQKLPEIAEGRVDDAASHLFKRTDAQVVAVFKVNPILGTRVLFRAYTKEGRDKTMEGLDVGLFTSNSSNNRDVVALMANEIPCSEYKTAQSEVGLWYIEKGMTYGCRISIPPEQDKFIGQITVGWAVPPENIDHAKSMLMIASTMLGREKK
jgi:hypothetical protein